jgi:PIN like domain
LYLDENLHNCTPILDVLRQHLIPHQRHGAYFAAGTEDAVWLPFVGQKGWILLTKDKRIRFNQLEKAAVRRHRVREFYFSSGNYTGAEMAAILVSALSKMIKACKKYNPPFIASISKSGDIAVRFE